MNKREEIEKKRLKALEVYLFEMIKNVHYPMSDKEKLEKIADLTTKHLDLNSNFISEMSYS